jgi:CsoR family transcriptional regulator, copper-sensing transcriptional repressor
MVEDDRYCIDIITQISAIQGGLEKVALGLLNDNTRHCVLGPQSEEPREERTEELVAAFGSLLGRSEGAPVQSCRPSRQEPRVASS